METDERGRERERDERYASELGVDLVSSIFSTYWLTFISQVSLAT